MSHSQDYPYHEYIMHLYWQLVRYLDSDLAAVPPVDELLEMLATFGTHARKDEAAVQGKFKNWARRITLVPDSTLMLGNRVVVPRDRYADIAWTFHIADPQRHLTISEVIDARRRSAPGLAAIQPTDNCGGRVSGVQFPPPWLRDSVTALAWAVQNRVRLNPLATSVELRLHGWCRKVPRAAERVALCVRLSSILCSADNCGGRVSGVQFPPPWLRDSVTALAWAVQNRVRLNPLATSVELRRDSGSAYPPPDRAPGVARAGRLAGLLARRLRDRASLPRILRIIDSLARDGCPWHERAPTRSLRRRKLPKAPSLNDAPGSLPNYRGVFEEPKPTRGGSSWLGRL
ncbi:hypothetical protein IscW_ISCW017816 [Ixodes scapularis]|uniref:Uncharacterized protein n=1 Tax=Ixodes scapularis TaxID=6945 RepID=B7PEU2_IXOSC|nr:hypothetical protein IscW_ISCW017816 [Ixodes scapularis]|eukprot:XP_002433714.1 hypothetical protein IscW_ISCW017816 [Ixodes scapularis]